MGTNGLPAAVALRQATNGLYGFVTPEMELEWQRQIERITARQRWHDRPRRPRQTMTGDHHVASSSSAKPKATTKLTAPEEKHRGITTTAHVEYETENRHYATWTAQPR
jgi:hypothetical protein